jgi:HEAT repeat protein
VDLLLELLQDRYVFARKAAMNALGRLQAEEALEPLARSASVEPDSRLRREARAALREIRTGDSEGVTVQRLAAEVEQLREQLRYHGDRIDEIDKRAP